jgi:hypothetical protein
LENIRTSDNPSYQQAQRRSLLFIQEKIDKLKHESNNLIPGTFEDEYVFDHATQNDIVSIPNPSTSPQNNMGSPLQHNADTLSSDSRVNANKLSLLKFNQDKLNQSLTGFETLLKGNEETINKSQEDVSNRSDHQEIIDEYIETGKKYKQQINEINEEITKNAKKITDLEGQSTDSSSVNGSSTIKDIEERLNRL